MPYPLAYSPRCVHLGNRFVMEFRSIGDGGTIDYVEMDEMGGVTAIETDFGDTKAERDAVFARFEARMLADDPPRNE